jgi:pSer/pThr/pTyr-binding forkhead associated (FHA) protein
LLGKAPIGTRSLDESQPEEQARLEMDSSIVSDVKVQEQGTFESGTQLRLQIEGSPEPILFKPKNETIFGRRDPATGAMPDIDLTPFAGYRMGVSRRHAAIRFGEEQTLDLWDLGSSNGTFLNGQRLNAHRPYRLHNGDELRLGQMTIRLYFESADKPTTTPADIEVKPEPILIVPPSQPTMPTTSPLNGAMPPITQPVLDFPIVPDLSEKIRRPDNPEQKAANPPAAPLAPSDQAPDDDQKRGD